MQLVLGMTDSLMIPLLPFVGLGMGAIVKRGVPYVSQAARGGLLALFRGWGWTSSSERRSVAALNSQLLMNGMP